MSAHEPIRRDPKYRPNHDRSVTISGVIDDALVSRLLPEIVKLQASSRDSITVYIDSPGGDTECARLLLDALRASDQDRSEPCRLIIVALGEAYSAASDILMAGDYALAYPFTKILCHGTRLKPRSSITRDQAAHYARYMAGQDEGFAITLARNCIDRFMFRISSIWEALAKMHAADTEASYFQERPIRPRKNARQRLVRAAVGRQTRPRRTTFGAATSNTSRNFSKRKATRKKPKRLGIKGKLDLARKKLHSVKLPEYLASLNGTIGLQPLADV